MPAATFQLLAALADLTALRDRDVLDGRVVALLADVLPSCAIRLLRCVGDPAAPRLLCHAHLRDGRPADVDAPWSPIDALPALSALPAHLAAFAGDDTLVTPRATATGGGTLHLLPVRVRQQRVALVELRSAAPLEPAPRAWAESLVAVYRNQLALLDYGECDTLTGLLNRKTFDDRFNKCMAADSAERSGPPDRERRQGAAAGRHWLGLVDIDHFKRVNDRHGHLIGDEVLLLVARLLRGSFRHDDLVYRFGGEEFVVLLRAPQRAGAEQAFERFRRDMRNFRFPQAGQVTASVGFTEVRAVDTATAAFERADRAVYHAKHQGRDRVACHDALVETGALEAADKVGEVELF